MKGKEYTITLIYKIFMIIIILSQLYALIFQVINTFTMIINVVIISYVLFRYYLLHKICNKVDKTGITLSKLLGKDCCEEKTKF